MELNELLDLGVEIVAGKLAHKHFELGLLTRSGPLLTPEGEEYLANLQGAGSDVPEPEPVAPKVKKVKEIKKPSEVLSDDLDALLGEPHLS